MHTYLYIDTQTHRHTCTHAHMHAYVLTDTQTHMYTYSMYVHTDIQALIRCVTNLTRTRCVYVKNCRSPTLTAVGLQHLCTVSDSVCTSIFV